jgi:hypothetical protein
MRTIVHETRQSFLDPLERADHNQHEFLLTIPINKNGGVDYNCDDEPAYILTIPSPSLLALYMREHYSKNEIAQLISLLQDGGAS